MNKSILILDDDQNLLNGIRRSLHKEDYILDTFTNSEDATKALDNNKYALVISDYYLNYSFGTDFLLKVKEKSPKTVRVLMTGKADLTIAFEAVNKVNIYRIILKPFQNTELLEVIEESLHQFHLHNLETIDNLKNEFFSIISHEFRTPFTVINNYLELIEFELEKIGIQSETISNYVKSISNGSSRLLRTINLIVNLAHSQSDKTTTQKTSFNLYSDVIKEVYEKFRNRFREKNISFELKKPVNEIVLKADLSHTLEIFNQLLENAIVFTNEGKVEIIISTSSTKAYVSIVDTGIGIGGEYLSKIFDPFIQEDRGYSRKFDGNGLGLTLVKNYCQINKFEISVNSVKGKGSIFTVTFNHNVMEKK